MTTTIHKLADVQSLHIGEGTYIWQFVVILPHAVIGNNCNIGSHCFIENDVAVGDNVTIKNGVQLWDGLRVEDHVFIGPNVTFTNVKFPRSKQHLGITTQTLLKKGASVGANATIICGVTIGEYSMVGAGSVVTRNVPAYAMVKGNPAKVSGWVNSAGEKLVQSGNTWVTEDGEKFTIQNNYLVRLT